MSYLYAAVEEATFAPTTAPRRALRIHLNKLSAALRAIEWNDSGDGADDEDALIRAVLPPEAPLGAAIDVAEEALEQLRQEIALAVQLDRKETK